MGIKSKYSSSIFLYLSLTFVVYVLCKFDYFALRDIRISYDWLLVSILIFIIGLLWGGISWWVVLKAHNMNVPLSEGISSHGISILSKYIPGKLWTVLGRAQYVSRCGYSLAISSLVSIKAQAVVIWLGLIISLIAACLSQGFTWVFFLILCVFIAITLILVSKKVHNYVILLISNVLKKNLEIPLLTLRNLFNVAAYYIFYWFLVTLAYYFFLRSILPGVTILASFAFPWSVTIGILAFLFPAGLGVREGAMIGYLALIKVPLKAATTASIAARLWSLLGEAILFLLCLIIYRIPVIKRMLIK